MILDEIVAETKKELAARKRAAPLEVLKKQALAQPPALDLSAALQGKGIRLIAEVKKASPSKGVIREDFDPVAIAQTYAANGAAAISVLTERKYFLGSLDYLNKIRQALGSKLPLLRKDFIIDPYQVYEGRAYGADALLLIAAILTPARMDGLLKLSRELGMECLVEVHNAAELALAVDSGARIIGINNRDLTTFAVDLSTTQRLRPLIPADRIVVSESGIKDRGDILKLEGWGVNAVLVGESLVSSPDIAAKLKELLA